MYCLRPHESAGQAIIRNLAFKQRLHSPFGLFRILRHFDKCAVFFKQTVCGDTVNMRICVEQVIVRLERGEDPICMFIDIIIMVVFFIQNKHIAWRKIISASACFLGAAAFNSMFNSIKRMISLHVLENSATAYITAFEKF
ncbi:MAG: hypothetical protein A2096_14750 [Spirochaetes bacterium GWF1_41_5]|nr:MAG: hypothetical protein A2096_14750 [Spirochaetes bacterium GWF1_41_5]